MVKEGEGLVSGCCRCSGPRTAFRWLMHSQVTGGDGAAIGEGGVQVRAQYGQVGPCPLAVCRLWILGSRSRTTPLCLYPPACPLSPLCPLYPLPAPSPRCGAAATLFPHRLSSQLPSYHHHVQGQPLALQLSHPGLSAMGLVAAGDIMGESS